MSLSPEFKSTVAGTYAFAALFIAVCPGLMTVTSLKNVPESGHIVADSITAFLAISGLSAGAYALYLHKKHNVW